MKYEKTKNESDLPIGEKLVKAEITMIDNDAKALELTFESGAIVRTSVENYSSFAIAIKAKPKMVERYKVSGKLLGVDLTQLFSSESDAKRYERQLSETANVSEVKRESVTVTEETIVIDDLPF